MQSVIAITCFARLLCLLMLACPLIVQAQSDSETYRTGVADLNNAELLQRANAGDPLSQHQLALRFSTGWSEIPVNMQRSLYCYNRAARQGSRNARNSIGELSDNSTITVDKLPAIAFGRHPDNAVSTPLTEPQAVIDASALSGNAPMTLDFYAQQSSDADGIILYSWDFGNGEFSSAVSASTTYDEPGSYVVTLVVMDNSGGVDRSIQTVLVEEPIVAPLPTLQGPALLTPLAGDEREQSDTSVRFEWSPVTDATHYDFDITDAETGIVTTSNNITPALALCTSSACRLTLASLDFLSIATAHTWRVRAHTEAGITYWSNGELQVVATATAKPNAPVAISPETDVELVNGAMVDFIWHRDPAAVGYNFVFYDTVLQEFEFTYDIDPDDWCDSDTCVYPREIELTSGGRHAWEIRAVNSQGVSDRDRTWVNVVASIDTSTTTPVLTDPPEGTEVPEGANLPPVASFVIPGFETNASGLAPFVVMPDASASSDDVVVHEWDFGDGSDVVTSANPSDTTHTYTTPGTYTITLTTLDSEEQSDSVARDITVQSPATGVTAQDAARLLTQASFGPRSSEIAEVQALGVEQWIDEQLLRLGPSHLDYVLLHSNGSNRWPRHEVWWGDVVDGDDQLRQRVAFALSQIFVVSDIGRTLSNAQYGVTHFYDQLREQAFGNYRDLLETVTLSPVMGLYLSMLQNAKEDPASNTRADENYAREVLQLFSIGLYNLNNDGTSQGSNTFTQDHIEAFARVFTGWNYRDAGVWEKHFFTSPDLISPMQAWANYHDIGSKTLLNNVTLPAGLSAEDDLAAALDNIFHHPNVGPFIGKQLIQKLVTSNPSADYVGRISAVFNDNGSGVRGDLGAVVKAILMDAEARTGYDGGYFGKVREPLLRMSHLWRAFDVQAGQHSVRGEYNTFSPQLDVLEQDLGQAVLRSPSVFNFYTPDFAPSGPVRDARTHLLLNFDLVAPEFEILTENNQINTTNRLTQQIQRHFAGSANSVDRNPSYLDFSTELSLAADSDDLLDHLDLLLLNQMMSSELRSLLKTHIDSLATDASGLSQRVRDAVTLIFVSPEYSVQR